MILNVKLVRKVHLSLMNATTQTHQSRLFWLVWRYTTGPGFSHPNAALPFKPVLGKGRLFNQYLQYIEIKSSLLFSFCTIGITDSLCRLSNPFGAGNHRNLPCPWFGFGKFNGNAAKFRNVGTDQSGLGMQQPLANATSSVGSVD